MEVGIDISKTETLSYDPYQSCLWVEVGMGVGVEIL